MKYKHYSFDLWLTLIKSDPTFKAERDRYFHEKFNRAGLSLPEVSKIIKQVDNTCNSVNEVAGGNITPFEMYVMILRKLEYPIHNLGEMDMIAIYHYIEGIFLKYPPVPYSEDTIPTLMKLKENGATLSILSNTGFILGQTITKLFTQHFPIHVPGMNLNHSFLFTLFSDQIGKSKPNPDVFSLAYITCQRHAACKVRDRSDILHIGDNEFADGKGAIAAGLNSYIINSNNKTIKDLLTL